MLNIMFPQNVVVVEQIESGGGEGRGGGGEER